MSPSPQAVIRLQGVSKVFPDVPPGTPPALSSLTADVPSGLVVGLVGPDAAGKTTLMRLLAGLLLPTSGSVEVLGRVPGSEASDEAVHDVGYMPQRFGLYEDLSVIDNLNLHAELRGLEGPARQAMFEKLLTFTALKPFTDRLAGKLSGGMKQKLGLACALLTTPRLLLLDEPFSALDAYLKWQVELELSDILKNLSCGTLFVTHNRDEVYRLCDTVCVLNKGKSDPKETVKELFRAPATMGAALISGCKNVSAAEVKQGETLFCKDWNVTLKTALHVPENIAYVGIRAHYFTTEGTENAIPCTVERVVENPFSTVVMLQTTGAGRLRWELDKAVWETLSGTEKLTLYVRPEDVMPLTE